MATKRKATYATGFLVHDERLGQRGESLQRDDGTKKSSMRNNFQFHSGAFHPFSVATGRFLADCFLCPFLFISSIFFLVSKLFYCRPSFGRNANQAVARRLQLFLFRPDFFFWHFISTWLFFSRFQFLIPLLSVSTTRTDPVVEWKRKKKILKNAERCGAPKMKTRQ